MAAESETTFILVDVGGVILNEEKGYAARFRCLREALSNHGIQPDDEEYSESIRLSILSRTPSIPKALVWQYTNPDTGLCHEIVEEARSSLRDWSYNNAHEAQPGIADALATLSRSHTLALAANASSSIKDVLESMGILQHFLHRQVSGDLGLSKPDIRFFLHILGELGAAPQQTIMVGDRLDNDMYPAQLLGMKTVWVRTGAHAILEPREPGEIPDRTIESPLELVEAVTALSSFR